MFETVVPETVEARSRKLFYETLPVSLVLHAAAIGAAVLLTVWNVVFPQQSPRITAAYSLTAIPDPPPPPPPPPGPAAAPTPKPQELPKVVPPPPNMIVAPTVIPDSIPPVAPPLPPLAMPAPVEEAAGTPGGDPAGQIGGEIGGKSYGIPGGIKFPDDGRVHIERDKPLPMPVVSQEYPQYPADAYKRRLEDSVVVRYIIGKDGRVKELNILDHAKEPLFDEATLKAIRNWRFRPMIKEGKPVEVVHELTVFYQIVYR